MNQSTMNNPDSTGEWWRHEFSVFSYKSYQPSICSASTSECALRCIPEGGGGGGIWRYGLFCLFKMVIMVLFFGGVAEKGFFPGLHLSYGYHGLDVKSWLYLHLPVPPTSLPGSLFFPPKASENRVSFLMLLVGRRETLVTRFPIPVVSHYWCPDTNEWMNDVPLILWSTPSWNPDVVLGRHASHHFLRCVTTQSHFKFIHVQKIQITRWLTVVKYLIEKAAQWIYPTQLRTEEKRHW